MTGGLGASGSWIRDRLAGPHDMLCLDYDHPDDGRTDVDDRAVDLTETGAVFDIITAEQPDTIVHWAAIPVAGTRAGTELYQNNTLAAHNALGEPLLELMDKHIGGVPDDATVEVDASAYATAKATRMLGWEPARSWNDVGESA